MTRPEKEVDVNFRLAKDFITKKKTVKKNYLKADIPNKFTEVYKPLAKDPLL